VARDIVVSAFASTSYQPWEGFADAPKVIDVAGIGSDVFMGSTDTERKPRESWGGKPFAREAEMFRARGGGSVLSGLLKTRAPGIEPRRIALVGFSAGNTFLSSVLKNPADAELLDTVLAIDGMTYSKDWRGNPVGFEHWISFARKASGMDRMQSADNPYKGPLLVVSYTDIVSGSPKLASSTREAARHLMWATDQAYWPKANQVSQSILDAQGQKQAEVVARLHASSRQIPLPLEIRGGNPPTTKTWPTAPYPNSVGYLGNYWSLGWGGQSGPDHIFQAHQCQQMLFRSFLIPRWNSRSENVAGLGVGPDGLGALGATYTGDVAWTTPGAQQPGGGLVLPGAVDTGVAWWKLGLMGAAGFVLGKALIDRM